MSISQIKRKTNLYYRHHAGGDTYLLKVIGKTKWNGIGTVVKCKVITKGWYNEIYLTPSDFLRDANTGHVRAVANTVEFMLEK